MIKTSSIHNQVQYSVFNSPHAATEYYLAVHSGTHLSFSDALTEIQENYWHAMQELNLSPETQIFSRIFLSDISNQGEELSRSAVFHTISDGAYSVIQQCPLNSGSISLFAYHILNPGQNIKKLTYDFDSDHWRNGVKITGKHYDMYWTANFSGIGQSDSFEQTNEIFTSFNSFINNNGLTLLDNTVRTWIYVRDIDNNYQGMVNSRKDYFYIQGLNPSTRYLASTGIEAKMKEYYSLVSMDALSLSNLRPEQIVRMEAPEHLCPTDKYGVTFERGTKIVFGDRRHMYISGTASIDNSGVVLHTSDIENQTLRTLENIEALLAPHDASLDNMVYLIVYLRNIKEADKTIQTMKGRLKSNVPLFVVQAPVCRPSWLVEIEGVAIIEGTSSFPNFL